MENPSSSSSNKSQLSESKSDSNKSQRRCLSAKWLIEEEYLFFQYHILLGNKWKTISKLFPGKNPKQIKNHFYSAIIKTMRRVLKMKFEFNVKEIMINYYSLKYLERIFLSKDFQYYLEQSCNPKKNNENVTLKKLIIKNQMTKVTINNYLSIFEQKVLVFLCSSNKNLNNKSLSQIFDFIIKEKLLIQCKYLLKENLITNESEYSMIIDYIGN